MLNKNVFTIHHLNKTFHYILNKENYIYSRAVQLLL